MKTIRIRNSACAAALALATIPATLFADYAKSFDISFPGYTESETLTNFPVLVRLSAARNDFKYAKCKLANGGDVRFFDADGTTVLPSEVDTWNPDGESLVWVRVPRLCEGTNIVCRYGNANPDPVTASDVWSEGYVGVWHLKEDKLPLADSSATSADFYEKCNSNADPGYGADGVVGKALDLCLTDESGENSAHHGGVRAADNDALDGFTAFTIEMWSFQNWFDDVNNRFILQKRIGSRSDAAFNIYDPYTNHKWLMQMTPSTSPDSSPNLTSINVAPVLSAWNHQVFAWDGSAGEGGLGLVRTFLNGDRKIYKTNATGGQMNASSAKLVLGATGADTAKTSTFPGKIDELRISSVARSDAWVKATYATINDDDFASFTMENDWDSYTRKFAISFPNYEGNELSNFPVLVKVADGSPSGFRYADCAKEDGADLRFADAAGNLLASEVDTWNTNGVSAVWVKVPSLSATTTLTAYYGNVFAPEADGAVVWSEGYVGVWHLDDMKRPMEDSTGHGLDFSSTSAQNVSGTNDAKIDYTATGVIGGGVAFDMASDHGGALVAFDPDSLLTATRTLTVEIWANPRESPLDPDGPKISRYMVQKGGTINAFGMYCTMDPKFSAFTATTNAATASKRTLVWSNGSTSSEELDEMCGKWNYFVMTHDSATTLKQFQYRDGNTTPVASGNISAGFEIPADRGVLSLGNNGAGSANAYPGSLDELRISNVARSPDWVNATYRTIADNVAFTTYGAVKDNNPNLATVVVFR